MTIDQGKGECVQYRATRLSVCERSSLGWFSSQRGGMDRTGKEKRNSKEEEVTSPLSCEDNTGPPLEQTMERDTSPLPNGRAPTTLYHVSDIPRSSHLRTGQSKRAEKPYD